jgi:hypothetical protein
MVGIEQLLGADIVHAMVLAQIVHPSPLNVAATANAGRGLLGKICDE